MKPESRSSYQHIDVRPYGPLVGAQVFDIDLSQPVGSDVAEEILQAHAEYGVLFFHDQNLAPEQHVAFAEQLGEINVNRFFRPVDDHPKVAQVLKEPDQKTNIGAKWHTDHSYDTEPALGSILYALEVPPDGGDTLFSSMYAAYDALSDGMKQTLKGLRAVHSSRHVFGKKAYEDGRDAEDVGRRLGNVDAATQDTAHPIVIKHPVSGRDTLYVNSTFTTHIEGWSQEESNALLNFLYQHGSQPEFTCRFRWQKGSIAFWDNRSTWHKALNDYDGHRRLMHRITLNGTPLNG